MSLTLTDMFCGFGGSSTGAIMVPGVTVRTAMNHWDLAIETHNANHPDALHVQADISQFDLRRIPSTDILWASPECTNHSVAKGKKRASNQPDLFGDSIADEAADRSRATMWDVPRYAEVHNPRIIITENVVDAARWLYFDAWLMAMHAADYEHHIVYQNSMHAQYGGLPAPQSRDRMYVVFWKRGNKRPDFEKYFRPKAYCHTCDKVVEAMQVFKKSERWGRYRAQYVYRCPNAACRNQIVEPGWLPAAAAIDWSLQGERIGDRKRPLAPKTIARIEAGLKKYHGREPFLSLMRSGRARNYTLEETLQTLTTEGAGHCFVDPMLVPAGGTWNDDARSVRDPMRALTTRDANGLLIPVEGREGKEASLASDPMRTQTTRNETGLMMLPLIVNNVSGSNSSRTATAYDPLRTLVGGGMHESLLMAYYGNGGLKGTDEPYDTFSTRDRFAMITPMRNHNTSKSVDEPLDTFAANGLHHAMITRHYSQPSGADLAHLSKMATEPLGSITTSDHHSVTTWDVPDVEDCLFRMLEPHEIKRGMAFPTDYIERGNKREKVRGYGNAVTPPNARDLIACTAESLGVTA